jgi:hypothetical protein
MSMLRHVFVASISISLLSACGPSGPTPAELEAQKKAEAEKKEQEDALAKRKAEREAKEQAEKDAAEALAKQIDDLAVLPEDMPKDLQKACDARAQAEDDFMSKHFEGAALEKWNSAKGTQLGFAKQSCMKVAKIEIPACQINALNNAPAELKKSLPDLLKRCIDKFGGEGAGAPPPPPGGPQ